MIGGQYLAHQPNLLLPKPSLFGPAPCGCDQPYIKSKISGRKGFLDGYYKDLQPGPKGGAKMRWLKPGVDFGKYNKIMLDSVIFYFGDDSEDKRIDAQDMKELADA